MLMLYRDSNLHLINLLWDSNLQSYNFSFHIRHTLTIVMEISLWLSLCVATILMCFIFVPYFIRFRFFWAFWVRNYKREQEHEELRLWDKISVIFLPENCLYCLNCRHHLTIFPAIIFSLSLLILSLFHKRF